MGKGGEKKEGREEGDKDVGGGSKVEGREEEERRRYRRIRREKKEEGEREDEGMRMRNCQNKGGGLK